MSPTANSKQKLSNQKKPKVITDDKLYTVEDLGGKSPKDTKKALDMDKAEEEKCTISPSDYKEDGVNLLIGSDSYIKTIDSCDHDNKKSSSLKASFKGNDQMDESEEKSLGEHMNTPNFHANEDAASKVSAIKRFEDSRPFKDNSIKDIEQNNSALKDKKKSNTLKGQKKRGKQSNKHFSREYNKKAELDQYNESPASVKNKPFSIATEKNAAESPIKAESSKGHHEMVSLLHNPNMLFNDASSIKYSVDNQNMSGFSIPSIAGEAARPKFDCLDGMCYDLISAFVGDKFPTFIFINKKVWNIFLDFQLEINDEVLDVLNERMNQSNTYSLHSLQQMEDASPKDTMKKVSKKSNTFSLSDSCHEKFCEAIQQDISKLMEILSNYSLRNKDIVIMKLYFTFMGRKYSGRHDNLFMRQTHRLLYDNRNDIEDALDPILHFKFTPEVLVGVKSLLGEFLNQSFLDSEISDLSLFDSFTSIIIEALQYWDLIPAPEENEELREVKQQIDLIQKMKDHLSKLKDIIV